jgi:signal transduction histidine kinase/CheY-like chemotaxis protein
VRPFQIFAAAMTLVLLTWLWLQGMNSGTVTIDAALRTLDEFMIAESSLHRDVLSARVGLLRNYDPLVRELQALYDAIERLGPVAAGDAELTAAVERLRTLVQAQERLTEQFKTDNALLQNSLAYFQLFSARLTAKDEGEELTRRTSDLATALLRFTTDTSPAAATAVDERLANMPTTDPHGPHATVIAPLLAHARMLRTLLPETDQTLKHLFAVPGDSQQVIVNTILQSRRVDAKDKAELFRYTLFAMSLLLFGSLVFVGIRLQSRALSLRRRAEIERAIAGISTRFINSRPHEIAMHVQHALEELARWIGADRAYFVVAGNSSNVYKWCREGRPFPTGWPEAAPAVAAGLEWGVEGAIQVRAVSELAHIGASYALRGANLHGWLCIAGTSEQRLRAVLGFDAVQPNSDLAWDESGLLRMAFDAIANALSRESLERDRERLQENLQRARRMETIGAFASGIAHNFNNIIGAILGYAETAQAHVRPGSRPVESLAEIRRAGERARDLVHQILTFGRRSDVRKARVCVNSLVAEAKSLLDASLSPYVNIIVRTTAETSIVMGEAAQLQQVILNVCNNAAQAIDAPGSIEIDVAVQELAQPVHTEHGNLVPGRYTVISVVDPGRGMDEMTQERIFEPFFSTRVGGNGLGLATVREIVLQHAGAVKVRSAPGAGTQFDIWLPCAPQLESVPAAEAQHASGRGAGETVLVLEPDRDRLLRHEEILAALGYEPVGFTDAAEAVAACRTTPTRFDAALLCCHLHGGLTLVKHIAALRENVPSLPLILATASAREMAAPSLAGTGISEIIRQPLTSGELAGALASCLLLK